jgi:hypothetical protein
MATTKKAAAKKTATTKRRTVRIFNPSMRPRTVKREIIVLSHTDPTGLMDLVNAQLATSVEPSWRGDGPQSGVEIELCSAINICAPTNVYAIALEKLHWEMKPRPTRLRRR